MDAANFPDEGWWRPASMPGAGHQYPASNASPARAGTSAVARPAVPVTRLEQPLFPRLPTGLRTFGI